MIKKILLYSILSTLITAAFSCQVQDSTAPTMSISKPSYGATFSLGDTVTLQGKFEDNEALNTYSLKIGTRTKDTIAGFNYSESNSISGTEYTYNSEIIIPNSVTDSLIYLHYNISDASGNTRNQSHLIKVN